MLGLTYSSLASSGVGYVGILDDYPNAAAAYSVRLLKSDYAGGLVEIRRSSDNALKTFYPDSNNELSLTSEDGSGTSLSNWITTDDGFIRTWYDQSGNTVDATQTTTANQPQIITSGAFITVSGKPSIDFDGVNDVISSTLSSATTSLFSNLCNLRTYTIPVLGSTALGSENSNDKRYWWRDTLDTKIRNGGALEPSFTWFNTPYIVSMIFKTTAFVSVYENGGSIDTQAVSGSSRTQSLTIGGSVALSRPMDMGLSEAIFWSDEDNARQSGVHSNQNDYYSIY
tara:strand:+ start:288 stop:1139 length:852 start_codon:yes stop_codon:yes gene_type:complete